MKKVVGWLNPEVASYFIIALMCLLIVCRIYKLHVLDTDSTAKEVAAFQKPEYDDPPILGNNIFLSVEPVLQLSSAGEYTFFSESGEVIGKLAIKNGRYVFWGDADASAQLFFEYVIGYLNK